MGIEENVMTPTYKNDFVLCKYELYINVITKLQYRHWLILKIKYICQFLTLNLIVSQNLYVIKCSHPFE